MLTKTKALTGIQCEKRLWLQENSPSADGGARPLSLGERHIIRQGQEVERKACERFPGGARVEGDSDRALAHTRQLMADGAKCLFQAAFSSGGALVRCDILRRRDDGSWDIIEVKSSTRVKDELICDLAVQWHVAAGAGVPLGGAFLMLVNGKDCVFPDLSNLMVETDVTDAVREFSGGIPGLLRQLEAALDLPEAPDIPIGRRCFSPRECPFTEQCWREMPKASVHTIPRLKWEKKEEMIQRGVLCAADADVELSGNQRRYVDALRAGAPDVDAAAVRGQLAELKFPLYFLDFETLGPAIPRFDGMRPYQQIPFQFSCHILRARDDALAEHREYLHLGADDPRRPLMLELIDCIDPAGSIVVYHKSMEDGVLKRLAADVADGGQAARLEGMRERLWDLEAVFKKNYLHPEFLGRTSIKAILPVLVPGMSYAGLEIQEGNNASAAWDLMICGEGDYADGLRKYCRLDTEGLVEIYRRLAGQFA